MPSADNRSVNGINMKTNEIFEANFDFSKPKSGFIFKTIVDPFIGRYSLIKVRSGVFKTDDMVQNLRLRSSWARSTSCRATRLMKFLNCTQAM